MKLTLPVISFPTASPQGYFDQFMTPSYMGIPLLLLAMFIPWVFMTTPGQRWLDNRQLSLQNWVLKRFNLEILAPIDSKAHMWSASYVGLALFLLSLNLFGLMPYIMTPTAQLSLSLAIAVPFWLAGVIIGFRDQTTRSLGHLLPESTPMLLIPGLIIIETASLVMRPIALGVRLAANLTAGHLLLELISTTSLLMIAFMPAVAFLTLIILFLLTLLELAVAMIQAYVFVLLLSLYQQENV